MRGLARSSRRWSFGFILGKLLTAEQTFVAVFWKKGPPANPGRGGHGARTQALPLSNGVDHRGFWNYRPLAHAPKISRALHDGATVNCHSGVLRAC